MASMHVDLVSPESVVFSGEAMMVVARTTAGEIAFLPGHVPFVGVLSGMSPVKIMMTEGPVRVVAVHSGFVEVSHDNVTILSDVAEVADVIDVPRAQTAKERAEVRLRENADDEVAQAALQRAELRLAVATATTAAAH
ncbi:MAG TPA: ATP synthase F1 subunit epsilon [Acidimicrobiales bacterium]|nr:ATP synthase F1 subunit epsilon [Acidimicrobiales bacterium]